MERNRPANSNIYRLDRFLLPWIVSLSLGSHLNSRFAGTPRNTPKGKEFPKFSVLELTAIVSFRKFVSSSLKLLFGCK